MENKLLRGIIFFLLGFFATVIILGFITSILPGFQISYILEGSQADWATAFATIAATVSALIIAIWGKSLGSLFYQPNVILRDKLMNIQTNTAGKKQGQTRLLFENIGNMTAEDVEVYVLNVYDVDQPRKDFLPVPLSWTHDGRSRRSFHPRQFGYLDFSRINDMDDPNSAPHLVLVAGAQIPTYEDILPITNKLDLIIFEKSGQVKKYEIFLDYKRPVDILSILPKK